MKVLWLKTLGKHKYYQSHIIIEKKNLVERLVHKMKDGLSTLAERIVKADYISMEELIKGSDRFSIDEIHVFLNRIIAAWEAHKLTQAAVYALLKFVYMYLNQPHIHINFKNRIPIPICYFSPYLIPSASLLYSYLKTLSFAVVLFSLEKTDQHLKEFIEKKKPQAAVFTVSQFLHVEPLKDLVPYLHDRDLEIFVGGIPFVYDESLKKQFSDCIFPQDLTELALLLKNLAKE